jgi:hypothetical protein
MQSTKTEAQGKQKRLHSIHATQDGPVFGALHRRALGKWMARHWGAQLDGGRMVDSAEEAKEYLTESFHQMFPDHTCSEQCTTNILAGTS